jgi:ADP-ribose pyrophosphatase
VEADEWTHLGSIHPFTTAVHAPVHLFLARKLRPSAQELDPGEDVRVVRMPLVDVLEKVMSGEIDHGPTCVIVLKAARLLGI